MKWYDDVTQEDVEHLIGYCFKTVKERRDKERDMEFDKSRVYTALNADELKQGDKVIVGDSLLELKNRVKAGRCCGNIIEIGGETSNRRFTVDDVDGRGQTYWELAYLVERKENCTNCSTHCFGKSWLADKYTRCESYKPPVANDKENCTTCANKFTCARQATPNPEQTICLDYKAFRCSDYEPKAEPKTKQKAEEKNCYNCRLTYIRDGVMRCMMNDHRCNNPEVACNHYEPTTFEKHYRPFRDTDELIKVWDEKTKPYRADTKLPPIIMPLIWVQDKETGKRFALAELDERILGYLFDHCTFLDGSPCGVEE